jgi:hypothetical protein
MRCGARRSLERFQPDWNRSHAKMGVPKRPPSTIRGPPVFRSPEGQMLWRHGKSYSQDLRERVFAAADGGERVGRIATMLRVSVSYVSKVFCHQ